MATKPSTVPAWNTGGANNATPTAGKIITGFENGERAASSYFNNRMKLLGEWCQYLSDGALTGAHTFGSTVGITGAVTCSSTLGVTGAVVLSSTLSVAFPEPLTMLPPSEGFPWAGKSWRWAALFCATTGALHDFRHVHTCCICTANVTPCDEHLWPPSHRLEPWPGVPRVGYQWA